MGVPVRITSFVAGEVSPFIQARIDLARYGAACKTLKNNIVLREGGIRNRPGTKFILSRWDIGEWSGPPAPPSQAPVENNARVIPFVYSDQQSYVIVLAHRHAQIIKNGAVVLDPQGANTAADATGVTLTDQDRQDSGSQWVPDSLIGYTVTNKRTGATGTITNQTYNTVLCSGGLSGGVPDNEWQIGDKYSIDGPYFINCPWDDDELMDLQYTQQADVMTIVHREEAPRELQRYTDTWTDPAQELFKIVLWAVGDRPATPSGAPTNPTPPGGTNAKLWQWVYTYVDEDGKESLPSPQLETSVGLDVSAGPAILEGDKPTGWGTTIIAANFYRGLSGVYGYVGQTRQTNAGDTKVEFTDEGYQPAFSEGPPSGDNPFGATGDYPGSVTYFEQRLAFGGTLNAPDTVFLSRPGQPLNFDKSIPSNDADALEFVIAQARLNEIRALHGASVLHALTSANEWVIKGVQGQPLTPTSVDAKAETAIGSARIIPAQVNDSVVFVSGQRLGVYDLRYTFEADGYRTNDLTVFARHLFDGNSITEMAYQKDPYSILWFVRADGVLLGMTYFPEQEVIAWHRHETDGLVESICVVPEGNEEALYLCVKRTIGGVDYRYIERMQNRDITDVKDAWFVDSGLEYDGAQATTIQFASAGTVTVRPNSHYDTGSVQWSDPENAYDTDTNTYATGTSGKLGTPTIYFSWPDNGVVGSLRVRAKVENLASNAALEGFYSLDGGMNYTKFFSKIGGVTETIQSEVLYNVDTSKLRLSITMQRAPRLGISTGRIYDTDYVDYATSDVDPGETATLTASASAFSSDDVGDEIWIEYGDGVAKFEIFEYTSPTVVTGLAINKIPGALSGTAQPWSKAIFAVDNLSHLEGETVSIFQDGNYGGQAVVVAGSVTMENAGAIVRIGLSYNSDMEPVDLANPNEPVKTRQKSIARVHLEVETSRGLLIGPNENSLTEWKQRKVSDAWDAPALETAQIEISAKSTWRRTGSVFVRQDKPLPLTILSITPEWAVGD